MGPAQRRMQARAGPPGVARVCRNRYLHRQRGTGSPVPSARPALSAPLWGEVAGMRNPPCSSSTLSWNWVRVGRWPTLTNVTPAGIWGWWQCCCV